MNTFIARLFLAALFVGLSLPSLQAEPSGPPPQQQDKGGGKEGHDKAGGQQHDKRPDFKAELNLSKEQAEKVDAIHKERMEAMKAIKSDTSLTPEQAKEKIMELKKQTQDKMNAVLTPEQQAKLETLKKNNSKGPGGPGGGPGAGPGTGGQNSSEPKK
jgi:Spy/CpxP family protein refolding chaperone